MSNNIKKSLVMLSAALICVAGSAFAYTTPSGNTVTRSEAKTIGQPVAKAHQGLAPVVENKVRMNPEAVTRAKANPTGASSRAEKTIGNQAPMHKNAINSHPTAVNDYKKNK
jgi:hypothetical protein